MNYGYEGEAVLASPIEVPATAKPGDVAHIAAKVEMLVCADVCVPQDANLTLDVPVVAGAAPPNPLWGPRIAAALAAAPKDSGLAATFQLSGGTLKLAVAGAPLAGRSGAGAYFYPDTAGLIDHAKPQAIDLGAQGLTFAAPVDDALKQGPAPAAISGVVETADGAAFEVSAKPGPPPPGSGGLGAPAETPKLGLALAALFAFAGRPDPQPDALRLPDPLDEGRLADRPSARGRRGAGAGRWRSWPACSPPSWVSPASSSRCAAPARRSAGARSCSRRWSPRA